MAAGRDYLSFMGLFWMTAPTAWLYALPAERLFEAVAAAKVNITLLAMVSVWRVWLITRVLSVLTGGGMWPMLVRVLLVAAFEVLLVTFFGGVFARAIVSSMSGMRNSPEEDLIVAVISKVFFFSLLAVPVMMVSTLYVKFRTGLRGLPAPNQTSTPSLALGGIAAFWVMIGMGPQAELERNAAVENLVKNKEYREAVDYLSRHSPKDFAPAKRLPPDPYDFTLYKDLPGLIAALDGSEAEWVRDLYIGYLDISFVHRFWSTFEYSDWAKILKTLDGLPGGPEWIRQNRSTLAERLRASSSLGWDKDPVVDLAPLRKKYEITESEE